MSEGGEVYPPAGTARLHRRRFRTARRIRLSRHRRGSLRRSGPESCRHSSGLRSTTRRSSRIARYLSCLRLLDCQLNGPHLVLLGIITQCSRYCDRLRNPGVNEIAMASLAAAIDKSGSDEPSDQFSSFRRHVQASSRLWIDSMQSGSQRQRTWKDTVKVFPINRGDRLEL